MSTCQSAPDAAPESVEDPRREETEPAELGLRLPLPTGLLMPPALEVERFFFITRPPSLEGRNSEEGDAGALSTFPGCEKYSLALEEPAVGEMGELGSAGEFAPVPWAVFHCLPSIGRYVLTFSPMHDKKAPVIPGVPSSGRPLLGS